MVIVSGASGHIGNVLVRTLLKDGYDVGVIDLDPEKDPAFKNLNVKKFKGDIRDIDFLIETFKQAEYVFHLAGIVSIAPGKENLMYSVNIQGTKNVVEACLNTNIKRLIYTSSVHALFEPPIGEQIVEKLANPDQVLGEYAKTKVLATREVQKGIKRGLDAVIVYPSGVIGPYDFKGSEMGRMINDYTKGKYRYYIDGAYNFVDVRDVANGLILALEKGKKGDDYILAGERITVQKLFSTISEFTGIKIPKFKIPMVFAKILAPLALIYYKITKQTPVFTPYSLEVLESNSDISSEKAIKKLGYRFRSLKESIKDILKWRSGDEIEI